MFHSRRYFVKAALAISLAARLSLAQSPPSFSGTWKLSNERSQPARKGDVTLRIDHHDPELSVETKMLRGTNAPRTAQQRYTTDGKPSTTTGIDGDEFVTTAVWKGNDLVMTVEEHEDGRTIRSQETWSLIEGGATLQRVRDFSDGHPKQTLIYLRQDHRS